MPAPLMSLLKRFRADTTGVAAVEFGLMAPLFVLALGVAVDCALVYRSKLRLISASVAATQFVLKKSGALTPDGVPAFLDNVRSIVSYVGDSYISQATVLLNNAPTSANFDTYYCVAGTSPETWTWTSTGDAPGSCGTGTAGKYLTIVLEARPRTFFTPPEIAARIVKVRDYVIVGIK